MDSKKLKKLREKYLDSGSQVFDPKFKKVADYQFNPEGVRPLEVFRRYLMHLSLIN